MSTNSICAGESDFNTEVISAQQLADDRWQISLSNGENRFYDALVVANGHHWDPRWPNPPYPGQFAGDALHAHAYRDPTEPVDMRRKKVLVVGLGNSAMDIACELAHPESAAKVLLSGRRGVWVLPKRAFGRPIDQLPGAHMPWRLQSLTLAGVIRATLGVPWHHGLPRPDHGPLAAHPTLSQDLYDHIDRGAIIPKPGITHLGERSVTFDDGTAEDVDVIVYCTGYKINFPFFDPGFLAAPGNDLRLSATSRPARGYEPVLRRFVPGDWRSDADRRGAGSIDRGLPHRHLYVAVGFTDDGRNGAGARAAVPEVRAVRTPHDGG